MTDVQGSVPALSAEAVAAYADALARADRRAAVAVALDQLRAGMTPERVLLELVCPAQEQVGVAWQAARWGVAREHAATAVSDAVVTAVVMSVEPTPVTRGSVVVGCVEEEWHALPARVVAEILALAGWQATFLGASTPPAHLAQFLHDTGPDAVALSCSVPSALPRARRMVEAAREVGVPVFVGGRGFGSDDRRARAVGANGWGRTAQDAVRLLEQRPAFATPPPPLDAPGLADHAAIVSTRAVLRDAALDALAARFPPLAAYTEQQMARTREDLSSILDFLAAALFVDDETVFTDFVEWLVDVLRVRRVPPVAVSLGLDAIRDVLDELPHARELVERGALVVPRMDVQQVRVTAS